MPTTSSLGIPYPAPTATPDVPYDMQQLAENIDASQASARPRCSLYLTTAPSLASSTVSSAISFDTELFDIGTMHSTVTNPTRVTATKAGLYLLTASTEFSSDNTTGFRRVQFRLNGTTFTEGSTVGGTGTSTQVSVSSLWQAALNDYAELMIAQNSTLAKTPTAAATTLKAIWLCP